ncbi:MAG: dihydrofolate reductase [bacterium]
MTSLSLIAAVAENRVIGRRGDLPWRLRSDMARFKRLTMGFPILMGRKTWDSLGGPLPGRTHVVLTRNADLPLPADVIRVSTFEEALDRLAEFPETFVIGGAQIYETALPRADRMYLTIVHARPEGDAFFPEWPASEWRVIEEERHEADERNEHAYTYRTLERRV